MFISKINLKNSTSIMVSAIVCFGISLSTVAQTTQEKREHESRQLELKDLSVEPIEVERPTPEPVERTMKKDFEIGDGIRAGVIEPRQLDDRIYTEKEIKEIKDKPIGKSTIGVTKEF